MCHGAEHQSRPFSRLVSGQATFPSISGPALDWLYLLHHAKPEKGHAWGSSLHEAAFQVGVTLLVASQEMNLVVQVDPCSSHTEWGHVPKHHPVTLLGPGSGLAMPPGVSRPGVGLTVPARPR